MPRLHDGLDRNDLALLEILKDRPVLVGRAVRIHSVLSTLITLRKDKKKKKNAMGQFRQTKNEKRQLRV